MIEVLVVDDSAFMRKILTDILHTDPNIDVIETSSNGEEAFEKTILLHPDVITMDVEMPYLDGISTVKRIMEESPTPIIMISAYTKEGAEKTIQALEAGAIDFVEKPGGPISLRIKEINNEIIKKVKMANEVNLPKLKRQESLAKISTTTLSKKSLVIIAASTGGPHAISSILSQPPENFPSSIIIIQHMPGGFTNAFAKRLNHLCKLKVKEARDGDYLNGGQIFVAPGGFHLELNNNNKIKINQKPPLHGIRPSADITMNSASNSFDGNIVGIILSGMGKDGAIGIRNIKRRGGIIIAQNKETSVVCGMPESALKTGFVDYNLPLNHITGKLIEVVNNV